MRGHDQPARCDAIALFTWLDLRNCTQPQVPQRVSLGLPAAGSLVTLTVANSQSRDMAATRTRAHVALGDAVFAARQAIAEMMPEVGTTPESMAPADDSDTTYTVAALSATVGSARAGYPLDGLGPYVREVWSDKSVLDDAQLTVLADALPRLEALHLRNEGHTFTGTGLQHLCVACTAIEDLDISGNRQLRALPAALADLGRLTKLRYAQRLLRPRPQPPPAHRTAPHPFTLLVVLVILCRFHPASLPAPLQWMSQFKTGTDLVASVRVFLQQLARGRAAFNVVKVHGALPHSANSSPTRTLTVSYATFTCDTPGVLPSCSWLGGSAKARAASWMLWQPVPRCGRRSRGRLPGCPGARIGSVPTA